MGNVKTRLMTGGPQWTLTVVGNAFISFVSLLVCFYSIFECEAVKRYTATIDQFDGRLVFYILAAIALSMCLMHVLGAQLCYLCTDTQEWEPFRIQLRMFITWIACNCFMLVIIYCLFWSYLESLDEIFKRGILAKMPEYGTDSQMKSIIDTIQVDLKCCGNTDYHDWFRVMWGSFTQTTVSIPSSCCTQANCLTSTTLDVLAPLTASPFGCAVAMKNKYISQTTKLFHFTLFLLFLELLLCGLFLHSVIIKRHGSRRSESTKLLADETNTASHSRPQPDSLFPPLPASYGYGYHSPVGGYSMPYGLYDHSSYYNPAQDYTYSPAY